MKTDISQIKNKVGPILKAAGITRSALFGSYVHGEATLNSDVDILVEFPDGMSLFDVVELKDKLEEVLGKKVDLVDYDHIKPLLKQSILSHQVPVL